MRVATKAAVGVLFFVAAMAAGKAVRAGQLNIAAAADLRFAMDEIVLLFKSTHPGAQIETSYGSSGQFSAQIRQGAPYDVFFSADIDYPRALEAEGYSASDVRTYGVGRIVLWGPSRNTRTLTLHDLRDSGIRKIAMANPIHAPYGKRAEQALKAAGVWEDVKSRLVYGGNIAQAAQYVQSGNAQVGIIALSLALSPELQKQGSYALIPDQLYQPLVQGFIITRRAGNNPLAREFAQFVAGKPARAIMAHYGFALTGEVK